MWSLTPKPAPPPDLEAVRRRARILVIDDHVFPAQKSFERDGYHFERWPNVRNLAQLTGGDYDLILLDIQGVGLNESPDLQGLGILRAIKKSNPAQAVIIYSAQPQMVSSTEYLVLADAVFDKGKSYVEYKEKVDELLIRHATPGYFIATMNRELGESAALAPRAVTKALRAFRRGNADGLSKYLESALNDADKVALVTNVITIGIKVFKAMNT